MIVGGVWFYERHQFPQRTPAQTLPTAPDNNNEEGAFPVPAIYSGYTWKITSSSYHALYVNPASNFNGSLSGQLYEVGNTDPGARAWEQMVAAAPPDQPIGFYGGERSFLSYYDQALRAAGYKQQTITLGTHTVAPMSADGPHGTIRVYLKYDSGKIRTIVVSSSNAQNQVFVSDIADLKAL